MASTNKCEYCGSTITSDDRMCPSCGAANPLYVVDLPRRVTDPKTIAELQEYCAERGMPLLRMRFFIGEDFKEPKAFGICKDSSGQFVVYKNKADGTRAVRYRGTDEERAVREIYGKLQEECRKRGIYPDGKPENVYREAPQNSGTSPVIRGGGFLNGFGRNKLVLIIIIIIVILMLFSCMRDHYQGGSGSSGYYGNYNGYSGYNDYNDYSGYYYNDDSSDSSWWSSDDDDDDSGSSWWSSDDDDDDDWSSSWDDSDWDSDWSDWDSDDSDWDSDW